LDGKAVRNGTFAALRCATGQTVVKLELNPEVRLEYGWGELGVSSGRPVTYNAQGSTVQNTGAASDFFLEGGASFVASLEEGRQDLRSGDPGQVTTATILHPIIGQGHFLTAVSMTYRYSTGFNCFPDDCAEPPHIELTVGDANGTELATIYTSPALDKYSYDDYSSYSPPQHIMVTNLRIPNSATLLMKIRMVNGKHNLALQMDAINGFNMTVRWSEEIGPDPPAAPSPIPQSPTNGLGVTRGPLLFALHPSEYRKVVKAYDNPPVRAQAVDTEIGTNDTWNFGLLPNHGFEFVSSPSHGWSPSYAFDRAEYPFSLLVKARQVNAWSYWQGTMITDVPPPSPIDCSMPRSCGQETELRLVPFGATHIRISVFPWVAEESVMYA